MVGFIIPLKSRLVSRDWPLVGRILERTLRSVCAQTDPRFRVVVVCHEIPDFNFRHPQIEFYPVDFDRPGPDLESRLRDKARKLYEGLQHLRTTDPTHVMVLDADDLVSHRLAAHVAVHPEANGWYFRSGYFHAPGMLSLHLERRRFHKWCGSSNILKLENIEPGGDAQRSWYPKHRLIVTQQQGRGTPLRPLPFRGAIYNVSHGENFNDYAPILWPRNPLRRLARGLLYHRQITPEIRDEFGLYPIEVVDRSPA